MSKAMTFEFATSTRILFGAGQAGRIAEEAAGMGRCALVVLGGSAGALVRAQPLLERLAGAGMDYATYSVSGEPVLETVREGLKRAQDEKCDMVIGCGGGSVLDTAKAVAAMMTNPGDPLDFVEVVGRGRQLTNRSAPCVAVPTTAGTGSEVTRNAVLGVPDRHVKVSMRSAWMLPRLAVVDPELTDGLPSHLTATTGLDAMTQVIEPFVSSRANPMTDGICREGMTRAGRSLIDAVETGDAVSREEMALASLCGGLALANAGLGAAHGLAGPIGGMTNAAHGAIVAALLPHVTAVNVEIMTKRGVSTARYDEVARVLTGSSGARAADGVKWLMDLCRMLEIAPLSRLGVRADQVDEIAAQSLRASSMKANPVALELSDAREMMRRAM